MQFNLFMYLCRRIEEAAGTVPIEECFLLIPQGIHDRGRILGSLELFAEKVIPSFAGAAPESAAAAAD